MQVTVKLFAYFRDNRFLKKEMDLADGTTVGDVITSLDIDLDDVGVTMINSRHCSFEQVPEENDQLAIFPVIGGG